jgi:hypothetical protein
MQILMQLFPVFEIFVYVEGQNPQYDFSIILSLHCEWLQSLSTGKCTYDNNVYFTLSGCSMIQLVTILREFTTK